MPRVNKQRVFVKKLNCLPDKDIWIFLISSLLWHIRSDASQHAFLVDSSEYFPHMSNPKSFLNSSYSHLKFYKEDPRRSKPSLWVPSRPFPFTSEVLSLIIHSFIFFLNFRERNISCQDFDFITLLCLSPSSIFISSFLYSLPILPSLALIFHLCSRSNLTNLWADIFR